MATGAVPLGPGPPGSGSVRIVGRYRLPSDVLSELKHALCENPQIVILDLHDLAGSAQLHEVLDPVAPYLAAWPGTVVVVCVPDPVASRPAVPATIVDRVLLARSHGEALELASDLVQLQQTATTFLTPQPEASEDARTFTRRTLREWDLPDLVWPASLVVSELVTHSILEAQTVLDLSLSKVDHLVRIAVHDYGADRFRPTQQVEHSDPLEDPLLDRGLLVVRALTHCWGVFPSRVRGKTVWAVLGDA